jgi:hypothetical protein
MSSWTCYSGSNNIHFDYPPIVSDGRLFTTYQPESVINQRIQKQENIHTNWSYRQYMQQNGLAIMKYNSLESCYELGLSPNTKTNNTASPNVPFLYNTSFDTNKPGYGYSNSDLKSPYLSREQLSARMISPSISMN